MSEALEYMCDLIDSGYEYPEAQWKASYKYGVDPQELADEYDRQYA